MIVGNPPYSAGQRSQNDDNQNVSYPTLDASIANTYAARSAAGLKKSLYDSYVRAIRWASNRLASSPNGGIIGYVSNGGWLDGNAAAGIRDTLAREFSPHLRLQSSGGTSARVANSPAARVGRCLGRAAVPPWRSRCS